MSYFYRILDTRQNDNDFNMKQYRNLWKIDCKVEEWLFIWVLSDPPKVPQHKQSPDFFWMQVDIASSVCRVFLISYQTRTSNNLLCNTAWKYQIVPSEQQQLKMEQINYKKNREYLFSSKCSLSWIEGSSPDLYFHVMVIVRFFWKRSILCLGYCLIHFVIVIVRSILSWLLSDPFCYGYCLILLERIHFVADEMFPS